MYDSCLNCHTPLQGQDACPACQRSQIALRRTLTPRGAGPMDAVVPVTESADLQRSNALGNSSSSSSRRQPPSSATIARRPQKARVPKNFLESTNERRYSKVAWGIVTLGLVCLAAGYPLSASDLENTVEIDERLLTQPAQSDTARDPFTFEYDGASFEATPRAEYDLHGLVISAEEVVDDAYAICVIWGEFLGTDAFRVAAQRTTMRGTCIFSTQEPTKFHAEDLGNNLLLSDSEAIYDVLAEMQVGDQIHLRGPLIDVVSSDQHFRASTSLKRGDGRAETMFVEEAEIIRPARRVWYAMVPFGWLLLIGGLVSRAGLLAASVNRD